MTLKIGTVCGTNVAQPERDSGEGGRGRDAGHGGGVYLSAEQIFDYARFNSSTVISPPTTSLDGGPQ
jgi:hypothetical protein